MCIRIHISEEYSCSSAVVVFFIVKLESKRSPRTDFVVDEMKENIQMIFVYIAAKF